MKVTKVVGLYSALLASNLCLITTNVSAQVTNPSNTQVTQKYSEGKEPVLNTLDPLKTVQSENSGLGEEQETTSEVTSSQTPSENQTASSENEETEQKETEKLNTTETEASSSSEIVGTTETETSSSSETVGTAETKTEEKTQTDSSETTETGNEKITAADPRIVLSDWDITVSGSTAVINNYIGPQDYTRAERVIPTVEELQVLDPTTYGKCTQVSIMKSALSRAASFSGNYNTASVIVSSNGSKVIYAEDSMRRIFSNNRWVHILDLNNLDVSNVVNMQYAFSGVERLNELGISTWDTSAVSNMDSMFESANIGQLYIPNFRTNGASTSRMFSGTSYVGRLLIVTDDPYLLNEYNFTQKPALLNIDSGAGRFPDGTAGTKKYFNTVAVDSKTASMDEINKWMQENQPLRAGYEFAGWEANFTNSWTLAPGKDLFAISNTSYGPTWKKITEPNVPEGSIKPIPDSKENLTLAYLPTAFNIPTTQLQESGQQSIPLENGSGFHVGVKDQNSGSTWQLNAQLVWNTPGIESSYIQSKNTNGQVYKNNNDGQSAVQESDFTPISEVTGTANLQIGTGAEVCVMQGNQSVPAGVYDFSLGDAELVIPEVEQVQPNQYAGQVNWNLVKAP
ncbi:putative lipoprotein [Enterococcus mundtii 1A]|uniref:BspA family leucine-rich repeat surface protein n=1 Tax=Enterococcus mundtii TaxID=53346 RepID=UPI002302D1C7|nr:BspA family leucine-rich repeat surface protein [Enterococcus mundtii]MDA9430193.1 putative lipoprotein [Enterococcus mundtii 1A]